MEQLNLFLTNGPSLLSCNFTTKETKKPKKQAQIEIECRYSFEVNFNEKDKILDYKAAVESSSENIPFEFNISATASFDFENIGEKKEPKEEIEKQAIIEAFPYLFSFLKEQVADLTRKANLKPFYLPSIELRMQDFKKLDQDDQE